MVLVTNPVTNPVTKYDLNGNSNGRAADGECMTTPNLESLFNYVYFSTLLIF